MSPFRRSTAVRGDHHPDKVLLHLFHGEHAVCLMQTIFKAGNCKNSKGMRFLYRTLIGAEALTLFGESSGIVSNEW
jgi:hypothetical protein